MHHKLAETCAESISTDYFKPSKKSKTPTSETSKNTDIICITNNKQNIKSKDNRKKHINQNSSAIDNYKISNNLKKMDHCFKPTSKNPLHAKKKMLILSSAYLRDTKKAITKERYPAIKVSSF